MFARSTAAPPRSGRPHGRIAVATLLAVGLGLLCGLEAGAADDPKAREIMTRVDEREDGDNQTSNMQMVLIDKRGK